MQQPTATPFDHPRPPFPQFPTPGCAYGPLQDRSRTRTPMSAGFAVLYGIILTVLALVSFLFFLLQVSKTAFSPFQIPHGATWAISGLVLGSWAVVCFCTACAVRESSAANTLLQDGVIPPPPNGNAPSVPTCASFAFVFAVINLLIVLVLLAGTIWFFTEYASTAVKDFGLYHDGHFDEDMEAFLLCLLMVVCCGIWPVILFGHSRTCRDTRAVLDRLTGKC